MGIVSEPKGATGSDIYLIRLSDAPVASYRGGVQGFEATNPSVRGLRKLDMESPEAVAYSNYLLGQQAQLISRMEEALGRSVEVVYQYYAANNGIAAVLTPEEAQIVSRLPGVVFVQRNLERELQTDNGPTWIGAPAIWESGLPNSRGEGIIIGVIDTGINPSNPSFADVGGDGYDHTNPWGMGNYVGVCDPTNPDYDSTFPCNDKLIGAWGYPTVNGGDPRDYDSHGSHTASTAGGNVVNNATVDGPTITISRTISGVAPHANIVAYSACCTLDALSAAIDQIVIDGVDVVNYSIGSDSPSDIWNDFDTVGYLAARDAGIFVATSAGNAGPGDDTLGSPADAPWLLSVGATTHDRKLENSLINMTGGSTTPPADIFGKGFTAGYGPAEIVYAGDYGDALCLDPFAAGTFTGEIVICDRGTNARVDKGANVLAGGAGGMVLANDPASGDSLNGDAHYLPAVHITYSDGVILKAWVADGGASHTGTINGLVLDEDPANGDIMAAFSSRGANRALPDIIVPSVSAPGVDILAAVGVGDPIPAQWGFISGTSMASPHAAGAAALLMATHPDWTPAEVQSVMMSTSWTDVLDDDATTPATPFDMGSGRIDLGAAANAGLVLHETTANYLAANPASGGDPKSLNLASFGNAQCVQTCSWTRTVESTAGVTVTWTATTDSSFGLTVDPISFELAPGETQVISVTADVSAEPTDTWLFGEVLLTPDDVTVSEAHFPVAVVSVTGDIPNTVELSVRRDAGSDLIRDLTALEITDLTVESFGLAQGDQYDFQLAEDPTNGDPYDDLDDVWWTTMTVPAGAKRIVAELIASTAIDLDLFVGMGATPSAATQQCASTSAIFIEYCNVDDPAAGTWWVLVQNWDASAAPLDDVTAIIGLVDGTDAGNLTVTGPTAVPVLEPFDLRLFWDEPAMDAGEYWYGAFSLGTDAGNPGNLGTVRVDLERLEDDVAKVADTDTADPGDTVNYTITVLPNTLSEDVTYWLTDTIPAGMTYVPGSAVASAGTVNVTGDTLTWTGTQETSFGASGNYTIETSVTDPTGCSMPLANSGAYTDLAGYGLTTDPGISGDSVWYSVNFAGPAFEFFGTSQGEILNFTDDGFAFFDPSTPGAEPWVNEPIPTPSDPNNLIATFWRDLEIVYDAATNKGVTIANLTSGGVPSAAMLEYDDVEDWPAGSGTTYDFEVLLRYVSDPGWYEVIMAYDNLNGDVTVGTIGLENANGSIGAQYAYDDIAVTDGMAVCFDYIAPQFDPVTITYAATVDADAAGVLSNDADNSTSTPGSALETTSVDVFVADYGVALATDDASLSGFAGTAVVYTVEVTNAGNVADTFTLEVDSTWPAVLSATTTGSLDPGETFSVEVEVTIPAGAAGGDDDVATVTATSDTDATATDSIDLTTTAADYILYLPVMPFDS